MSQENVVYIHVCVCVCVCVYNIYRERQRERILLTPERNARVHCNMDEPEDTVVSEINQTQKNR